MRVESGVQRALHSHRAHTPRVTISLSVACLIHPFPALGSDVRSQRDGSAHITSCFAEHIPATHIFHKYIFLVFGGNSFPKDHKTKANTFQLIHCVTVFLLSIIIKIYFSSYQKSTASTSIYQTLQKGTATNPGKIKRLVSVSSLALSDPFFTMQLESSFKNIDLSTSQTSA